jgi:hypothetical protein
MFRVKKRRPSFRHRLRYIPEFKRESCHEDPRMNRGVQYEKTYKQAGFRIKEKESFGGLSLEIGDHRRVGGTSSTSVFQVD